MNRVASLLPSSTEIVHALGQGDRLVCRSHECDHPAGVASLPAVTSARLDSSASSAEIDRDVQGLLGQGLSIYAVDEAALRDLAPDVILTQTLCDVCAVSLSDVERALEGWESPPSLVSLAPNRLGDVWDDVQRVADALGVAERGRALVASLEDRLQSIASQAGALGRQRVALIEWIEPLMGAGNWMPELAQLAGGTSVLGREGEHSHYATLEQLAAVDPDVVVVLPCGFDLTRTRRELAPLQAQPAWCELRAVREGRVALTDGNAYFNRPGPRLVESVEILAEILHPAAFDFGRRGAAWEWIGG